jgi:hypothetical protein
VDRLHTSRRPIFDMALPEIFMINAGMLDLSFLWSGIATFIFLSLKIKKSKKYLQNCWLILLLQSGERT